MYLHSMYIHKTMTRKTQSPRTLRSDARAALQTCAGWNLRVAARRVTQFLEARMDGAGLSFSQFGLMAEIASAPDDTLSALAERMGLDQSTLSRTLRTLEGDGLVEIAVAESDQRKRMVWLTEKGARRLEAALASWRRAHAELDKFLSTDLVRRLALEAEKL
jgi:DNA-binding MarR family transcriptional regulator